MGKRSREKRARLRQGSRLRPSDFGGQVGGQERKFEYQTGLERVCLFIIRWGTYLVLFTPLIISLRSFFPFVTPKTIYFRILVEIIFAVYLLLAISFPYYRPKINSLSMALFVFIIILILASVLGINFERSFWSTYERMTGIFTFLHLLTFFIILTSVFKKREDWEKILGVSIFAGVLLSLYVLRGQEISTRGGGTIGNTSFMATYLLFNIFFALILFLSKKDLAWRIFSGISFLIILSVLLTSSARGATFSFYSGLFLLFLGYLIFSQKKILKRAGMVIIFSLIILAIILAIYQPLFIKNKIEQTLHEMEPRFTVWEKGWKGFLERPVFGWGPENFNVVFNKYFNPCMFLGECGGEIWFDRSHNIIFDTLSATGIVGFLSYLSLFAVSIFGLLRVCLKERENFFFSLGMAVLLLVYFFQNLLVFDMISSYTVFFLSLGFIGFLIGEKETAFNQPIRKPVNSFLCSLILVFTLFLLYFGNIQPALSAANTVNMVNTSYNLEEAANFYKNALNTFMEKYEIREQFSQRVYRESFESKENQEVLRNAFALAEEGMEESIRKNSLDFRPHLFLGRLYFSDYYFSKDPEKLNLAEKILQKATELSPKNQQGYWHMAEVKLARGESEQAINLLQKAIDLEPRFDRSHWYLAIIYKLSGQYEKALEKMKEAEKAGYNYKENSDDLQKAIEVFQALKDDLNLVPLYQRALELQPENTQVWAGLAASYANLGEFEKAKEAAKKVMEINPNLAPQVEEFLRTLP